MDKPNRTRPNRFRTDKAEGMTQEEERLWIYIKGGDILTGANLNAPDTMATLTVEVTVKARYKDIKEFMSIDKLGIEHLNKLITK